MDDLISKHEAELFSQHPLSLSGSIVGDSSVPFVQYLVIEQVRGGEIDMRGMGYKIINSSGNNELRIQKPIGGLLRIGKPGIFHLQLSISFRTFPFPPSLCPFISPASCSDNISSYFSIQTLPCFLGISC